MTKLHSLFARSFLFLALAGTAASAGQIFAIHREAPTVEASIEVLQSQSAMPLKCIPPALLCDAKGVAVFPHLVKAGLVIDKRFGHGVVLLRQPDGAWSDPILVDVEGGGVGLQAGIESTDLVLVFKKSSSLDAILSGKGKLTLGTDVSVAAGPVGREAGAATDGRLKADVFTYSRSRGLFAGVAVDGARIYVDFHANEAFYGVRPCGPDDILNRRIPLVPAAQALRTELGRISMPPSP
jgi:lipid-binding SYLF domain-containing protein